VAPPPQGLSDVKLERRQFTNLLLFVGVMAMAFVAWLDYRARHAGPAPVLELAAAQIDSARIEYPRDTARDSLELRREGDDWWLVEPFRAPLDRGRVAALLSVAEALPTSRYARLGRDLAEFGLQPPRARLLLDDERLGFGDVEAGGSDGNGRRYLLYGDQLMLLADRHYPLLDAGLQALADLRPLGGLEPLALRDADGARITAAERLQDWRALRAAGVEAARETGADTRWLRFEIAGGGRFALAVQSHPLGYALQPDGAGHRLIIGRALGERLGL